MHCMNRMNRNSINIKNPTYTDVRFGTVLSINIASFNNNFSQTSVLYLQTNCTSHFLQLSIYLRKWHYCLGQLPFIPGRFSVPRLLFSWCILKNMTPEAAIVQTQPNHLVQRRKNELQSPSIRNLWSETTLQGVK